MVYGYVRVSSRDQNEARQVISMQEYGVPEKNIIIEKQSGKDFNRPMYLKLVHKLRKGDVLVIKSIDRLGRNYDEIKEQWHYIANEKKVDFVVLDMPILNTRQERDLTNSLIADIVLGLLSYVAQQERDFIHQRQAEGISAAMKKGVKFGRPKKERPEGYETILVKWKNGNISATKAGKTLGVSCRTFLNWANELEN